MHSHERGTWNKYKMFLLQIIFKNLTPPPVYLRHLFIYWIVKDLNLTISSVSGSEAKQHYTVVGL